MIRINSIRSSAAVGAASLALAVGAALVPATALAMDSSSPAAKPATHTFRVTITNLMKGQPLSPPLIVTNYGSGQIFKPGRAANWGVQQVAENGNNTPLYESFLQDQKDGYVTDTQRSAVPLLPPGTPGAAMFPRTVTLTIKAKSTDRISWISMLGCTNDGFAGFNAARLPQAKGRVVRPRVLDYDAGTEENTEDFANLGQGCQNAIGVKSTLGTMGTSETDWRLAEGEVVHRHEGVFDVSDDGLQEAVHGWNPRRIAAVTITRLD